MTYAIGPTGDNHDHASHDHRWHGTDHGGRDGAGSDGAGSDAAEQGDGAGHSDGVDSGGVGSGGVGSDGPGSDGAGHWGDVGSDGTGQWGGVGSSGAAQRYAGPTKAGAYLAYAGPIFVDPNPRPRYVTPRPRGLSGLVLRIYERTPTWGAPAAILACFLGAASYVWISNPTNGGAYDIPTCIVKLTTGLDCPGCGGTRAFYYLLHGDVAQAIRYHALAVFAAPFLVWMYVAWTVKRVTGRKIPTPTIGPRSLSAFLIAWAVFSVVRNLPFAPFTSLYV